jgi:excisionase family DNA binding protein
LTVPLSDRFRIAAMQNYRLISRPFISPVTFAAHAGVAYNTVLAAIRRGELPALKIGRVYRIPREALESWRKQETAR